MGFGVMRAQALDPSSANDLSTVAQFSHTKIRKTLPIHLSGCENYIRKYVWHTAWDT